MTQIVVLLLAILSGVASHYELAEFNKTSSEGKVPPVAAGVAGFLVGLLIGFLAPAIVLGALVGLACFHEVRVLEHQTKERLLGMQTLVWAVVAGLVAFVGGSILPLLAWLVVCVFAGSAGAFYLLYQEKQRLEAENRTWISENQRLLLERGARGLPATTAPPAASAPPAAPVPAAPVVAPRAPAPAPPPLPTRTGAVRKPPTWGATPGHATAQPVAPTPPAVGGDFLPRR